MTSVCRYVEDYEQQLSVVVGEEDYTQLVFEPNQNTNRANSQPAPREVLRRRRRLRSEFALLRLPTDENQWIGVRDVFQADGRTVPDRTGRLSALLKLPFGAATDQWRALQEESSRFNIGDVRRTLNVPTFVLRLLRCDHQARFAFDEARIENGSAVVDYREVKRPTVVRDEKGEDEPMTRPTTGNLTTFLAGGTQPVPAWLKLARSGSTVTASISADGATWTVVGSTQVSIASSALVGLAVTSHDTTRTNTSTFASVAVTGGGPPPPQPPGAPASPSPANGATGVSTTPTLTWSSSGATSYDVAFGTANPPPQVATGRTSASYTPPTLTAGTNYFWQIIARNSAGSTTGAIWSFTTATTPPPPNPNIVIYASDIPTTALHGSWSVANDATSPNGTKLSTTDAGFASTDTPLASPTHYVDVTFTAAAGIPYRLWMRLEALNNSKLNDSLWVQFSDARVNGNPIYPLNSTSGLDVNLATDSTATSLNNWGWQNTAYWLSQSTTFTFASSGTHTMRIQVREDGVQFDQIVLSPSQYLSAPPGGPTNDATIVPKP